MVDNTALKAEFKKRTIEGRIRGLAAKLNKLAPHPDMPNHRGPLFISLDKAFKPAAEYDGMMGSLALESVLGLSFAEAAINDNSGYYDTLANMSNFEMAMEASSEYLKDLKKREHGQGSFAYGTHDKPVIEFANDVGDFVSTLGQRLEIEETLAELCKSLDALKRTAQNQPTLEFCT